MSLYKTTNLLFLLVFLSACGTLSSVKQVSPGYYQDDPAATLCMEKFSSLDTYITSHGLADSQARRVQDFPFLRTSRFLASYANEQKDTSETAFWVEQLASLDLEGRQVEVAAIPLPDLQGLLKSRKDRKSLETIVNDCRAILQSKLLSDKSALQTLEERVNVPDNYNDFFRIIGLYPVTSLPVMWGVHQLHKDTRERLMTAFPGSLDQVKRYAPATCNDITHSDISRMLQNAGKNPLGIPLLYGEQLQTLFRCLAPVFEIETVNSADLPGFPVWQDEQAIGIDIHRPTVFTHLSHTRFYGQILVQLNYTIWFPERPLAGRLDLLGGHLDGITWRMTLDADGQPMIFDIIHNCGCYHIVFTTPQVQAKEQNKTWQEPMLTMELPSAAEESNTPVLSFESGTHYLSGIRFDSQPGHDKVYNLAAYNQLRQLPYRDHTRRSMFASNGIVPGTERAERWLLWPMGVPEPGAMRQWGHHAIAFIGKRHFDDPYLLEKYFSPAGN